MTKPLDKREKKVRAKARASTVKIKKKTSAKPKKKPATKAKKAAKTELSDKDLNDVEEVVDFLMDNCPDSSPPVTAGELDSEAIGGPQVLRNALKLGRIVKDGDGYRLNKGHGGAKKAAATMLNDEERRVVETVSELVKFIAYNYPGDKPPATFKELVSGMPPGFPVPSTITYAIELGDVVRDGDGYRLVKAEDDEDEDDAAPREVDKKLDRCERDLKREREERSRSWQQCQTTEAALRQKVDLLESEIVGWELRNNVQVLAYRFERWEHDRLRDAYVTTVKWLESWLDGMDSKASDEWTVDDWRDWARRQADGLRLGLAKMKPFQRRQQPLTEVRPEPPESFHKMLAGLMSQLASQDAGWGPAPGKRT